MKKGMIILFATILLTINNLKAEVLVKKDTIENIKVEVSYGYFTAIELENEIQGLININTDNIRVERLNNKSIIVSTYKDNLPERLGKIIISDGACNKYSLEIVEQKDKKKQKDTVIYIKNSNKEKTCEAIKEKGTMPYMRVGSIQYQE